MPETTPEIKIELRVDPYFCAICNYRKPAPGKSCCDHCLPPDEGEILQRAKTRGLQSEVATLRNEIRAAWDAVQSGNHSVYAVSDPDSDDATVSLAQVIRGMSIELDRRRQCLIEESKRITKLANIIAKIEEQCERIINENARLGALVEAKS